MYEYLWEDIPECIDFADRQETIKEMLLQEEKQEREKYEQFRNNREPFEWYCYEDEGAA